MDAMLLAFKMVFNVETMLIIVGSSIFGLCRGFRRRWHWRFWCR
jgi:hypothetical protein